MLPPPTLPNPGEGLKTGRPAPPTPDIEISTTLWEGGRPKPTLPNPNIGISSNATEWGDTPGWPMLLGPLVFVVIGGPLLAWLVHYAWLLKPVLDAYLALWPPEFR